MLSSTHHILLLCSIRCDSSKIHPSSLGQKGHVGVGGKVHRSMRKENNKCKEENPFLPLPTHFLPPSSPRKDKVVCNALQNLCSIGQALQKYSGSVLFFGM